MRWLVGIHGYETFRRWLKLGITIVVGEVALAIEPSSVLEFRPSEQL